MSLKLIPLAGGLLCTLLASQAIAHGAEDHDHTPPPPGISAGGAQRLVDGSLFVPKAMQHRLGVRTAPLAFSLLPESVELNGTVIAEPNAGGRVQASQSGRVEAGRDGLPWLGQRVRQGQILAWLRPTRTSMAHAEQAAALAELEAALAIVERRQQRYQQLDGVVPRKDIEATSLELEALRRRQAALSSGIEAREALTAPISGVIAATRVTPGQVVEARETLFEIVDPTRLAVEALAYDARLAQDVVGASAALPHGELRLAFMGAGPQLRAQAMPLLFRVVPPFAPVGIGQTVKVVAATKRRIEGAAVPRAAVLRDDAGETLVWLKLAPERFAPRRVRAQSLDAARMVLTAGVTPGERVVVEAANLLAQVR